MRITCLAIVRKEPNTDFGVEFPDYPGCISSGATIEEAMSNAHALLSLHLRGMIDDNEPISTKEIVMAIPMHMEVY